MDEVLSSFIFKGIQVFGIKDYLKEFSAYLLALHKS